MSNRKFVYLHVKYVSVVIKMTNLLLQKYETIPHIIHDFVCIAAGNILSFSNTVITSVNLIFGWYYTNVHINILLYYILENIFNYTGYELKHTSLFKILQQ